MQPTCAMALLVFRTQTASIFTVKETVVNNHEVVSLGFGGLWAQPFSSLSWSSLSSGLGTLENKESYSTISTKATTKVTTKITTTLTTSPQPSPHWHQRADSLLLKPLDGFRTAHDGSGTTHDGSGTTRDGSRTAYDVWISSGSSAAASVHDG